MERIDFVIPWVDGSDPKWIAEKDKFDTQIQEASTLDSSNAACRYRGDAHLLRYWFRGVEKCAPWVNKIHFVTCGQKPEWLNENHPKLNLVNHKDYIPAEFLPTFNSNVIELNYHRIEELSEHFVLFNDDCFLLQPLSPSFFFKNGNPVLDSNLRYPDYYGFNTWSRVMFNDYCVVNKSFDIKKAISKNAKKWFSIKDLGLGRSLFNYLSYRINGSLPVGNYGHIATPQLKSTLQEIWDKKPEIMAQTSAHKFRTDDQVNQWILSAWNQAKGPFYPSKRKKLGIRIILSPEYLKMATDIIENRSYPQICLNDTRLNVDPATSMLETTKALERIFPEKSLFEQ